MTARALHALVVGLLLAAPVACGPASAPTPSVAERATGLALTAAVVLTSTASAQAAQVTPASATAPPSPTPAPSATAARTAMAPASATPPTDTPTPFVSPTPCENDSAFVSDVSVPDGTHFAQGAAFVKTWRLRNDGVCAWTTAYTFRHVSGDAMGGTMVNMKTEVPAGGTVDIAVPLTAPAANGTFRGEWQLHSPAGDPFGSKPFVEIVVP